MAYASVADIQTEFKSMTIDANSAVTDTEVEAFINQEEAVINATISNRYETPITGVNSLLVIASISIAYVAFRVATILNLKKDVSVLLSVKDKFIPQELNQGSKFKIAKKQLSDIQTGKIVLTDAVARSLEQGVKSYNTTNSIAPLWERDTKQW